MPPIPKRNRKSPRLPGHDYSSGGIYFVTICTHQRLCRFGVICDGNMKLNALGQLAERCWTAIPQHFSHVELDAFVVMPNDVHGLVILPDMPSHQPLGVIIGTFKAAVTRELGDGDKPLWQERYHDHIVRDETSLRQIRAYIVENPAQWAKDSLYSE